MINKFKNFITKESHNLIWFIGCYIFILTNANLSVLNYESTILTAVLISLFFSIILNIVSKKIANLLICYIDKNNY